MNKTDALKKLYGEVFDDGGRYIDFVFKEKYSPCNALYAEEDGKTVSCLFISDRVLSVRGTAIKCPYICGVATLAEYRRRGHAEKLILQAFDRIKKEGSAICALHPFRHSFYEKFGFAAYCKVKNHKVKYFGGGGCVSLAVARAEDIPFIEACYSSFMSRYGGFAVRDRAETIRRFNEMRAAGCCALVLKGGVAVGYIYYEDGFINEYCAPEKYLAGIPQIDGYEVNLPIDSDLGNVCDFTMVKITDRELFLDKIGIQNSEGIQLLSDAALIRAAFGTAKLFGETLPQGTRDKFSEITNYVFDKY